MSIPTKLLAPRVNSHAEDLAPDTKELLCNASLLASSSLTCSRSDRAERDRSSDPLYLAHDSHWTPRGMELAASATAARIIKRGWMSPGTTRYKVRQLQIESTAIWCR